MQLPESVEKIIHTLETAGFEAYAVGGCVRDVLLGLTPDDWDITTSAEPSQVKSLFQKTIDTGIQHGTVTVRMDGKSFEVTTYRIDGKYEDGRHPDEVTFTKSLEEDLKRRDFTINAMAYNGSTGLVDLYGGQEDLEKRVIRCVGDPGERFTEDALRMMRAVRFAAKLDFSIEENTRRAITRLKSNLSKVSAERIQVELTKLITSDHPKKMYDLFDTGLTSVFFPEWDAAMICDQNTKHHMYTVGWHTIHVMENVRPDKVMRLAAMLHDIGKPVVKRPDKKEHSHFQGHPQMSDIMAEKILRRLKYDNDTIHRVRILVRYHDERPALNDITVRRCMNEMDLDFNDLFELKRADTFAQSEYMREEKFGYIDRFEQLYRANLDKCTDKSQLAVNGGDLINEGINKGPQMGRIIDKMLDDVLTDPSQNTRENLIPKAHIYDRLARAGKLFLGLFAVVLLVSSCSQTQQGNVSYRTPGTPVASGNASGDATNVTGLDKVYIIEENDKKNDKLTVMNVVSYQEFRYPYTVLTEFLDKYGDTASIDDFQPGMAITFDAGGRYGTLTTVQKSDALWERDDVTDYSFDESEELMKIGGTGYHLPSTALFLDGNTITDIDNIEAGADTLRVVGNDNEIVAVAVAKGHGYLTLTDTKLFDGSLIEIGTTDIEEVSDGKSIALPVGTYNVTIANNGWGGTKKVKIKKNVDSYLSLDSMKGSGPKKCKLTFEIGVKGAKIYLDGKEVKKNKEMSVAYGDHSLTVVADGYDTWSRTLVVNSKNATIALDISDSKEGGSSSASSSSSAVSGKTSGTTSGTASSGTTSSGSTSSSGTTSGTKDSGSSSSTSKSEKDKAEENYLSTLANSIVNSLSSSND